MKKAAAESPAPIRTPVAQAGQAAGSPTQQAFQQAIIGVESLREQLRSQRVQQAEARRRYWQQVGPVAAAVVVARRSLFPTLEDALLLGYFTRLEEQQITSLILSNVRALEERFGEDESALRHKYAPDSRPQPAAPEPPATAGAPAAFTPDPTLPPHEQAAAAARARRKTKAQRQQEAAAQADQQQLESNAKTIYRQLARTHHPDLERDPDKQADKTAQMQRITEAYEADDLYALLQLLSETGPADAAADDVLARYTRALLRQQAQLQQELKVLTSSPGSLASGSEKKQRLELRQVKRDLRAEAEYLAHIARLMATPAGLRDVLRSGTQL